MKLKQHDPYRWEIPKTGQMNVPGRIYASADMLREKHQLEPLKQVMNVAMLPGIVDASLAMPDMHWGYGFPIGGVAAFDMKAGVVSPGGVGYDINCGVRLLATNLEDTEIVPVIRELADVLYREIPCGLGSTGRIKLSKKELRRVAVKGSRWAVENGMGEEKDLTHTEEEGAMKSADPRSLSDRALKRGERQLGTLGSGNHFLEVGRVDRVYDQNTAAVFGLAENQVTVMLHSGSRGFGYQVCDDFLARMNRSAAKHDVSLPERQLACAPIQSDLGREYLGAMACAANYAWANRQVMTHLVREAFMKFLNISPRSLGMRLTADVCHNIAQEETHIVEGKKRSVLVHRKGATRAFPAGHGSVSGDYQAVGQPILIPGDMGTASYVLVGTRQAMKETFGSASHGAGRILSRKAAKKAAKGRSVFRELEDRGIHVRWTGRSTLAEEMPEAYKNVSEVVEVLVGAGICKKIARLRPMGVIKG